MSLQKLARELDETARQTAAMVEGITYALETLADKQLPSEASRKEAVAMIVAALQGQDRIEQRCQNMALAVRQFALLPPTAPDSVYDEIWASLVLDELRVPSLSGGIALRLGVTPLVIGLTIVAFGTGTPELLVSIEAASTGNSGLALGNIVGSNISNVALILGCAALARPLRVRSILLRREVPLMIVVTLLLCVMLLDGGLSRLDGAILLLGSIVYTVGAYVFAKRDRSREVAAEYSDAMPPVTRASWIDMLYIVGGLVALMLGAKLLVSGATVVAVALGMNQVVIGLTVVAIGTSMPELATSVVAAFKDETDVAFGNVLGSNILNILCILGLVALIQPFGAEGLTTLDLAVLAGSAIVLLPLMSRGSILNRWEGAGLLVGYVIYVGILVSR